jgi:hypothetical protein
MLAQRAADEAKFIVDLPSLHSVHEIDAPAPGLRRFNLRSMDGLV